MKVIKCKECGKETKELIKSYCKECYNKIYFDKEYYIKLCEYLKGKFDVLRLHGNVLKQIKEMKDSGLNYKQILYIIHYTFTIKKLFNIKYNYTIALCMQKIHEALEHAKSNNIDLFTIDKDYFLISQNKNAELKEKIDKFNEQLTQEQLEKEERKRLKELEIQKKIDKIEQDKITYLNSIATSISEKQLEDYLINHLDLIEEGMQFIERQYPIERGILDILAKDKSGKDCIIELKVDKDDKRLIFQCGYYPSQINNGNCRMITVAPDYHSRIAIALKNLNYVEMYTYKIDFGLNKDPIKNLTIERFKEGE